MVKQAQNSPTSPDSGASPIMEGTFSESASFIPPAGAINAEQLEREALQALNALRLSQDRATATRAEWVGEYLRRLRNTLDAYKRGAIGTCEKITNCRGDP